MESVSLLVGFSDDVAAVVGVSRVVDPIPLVDEILDVVLDVVLDADDLVVAIRVEEREPVVVR
jgi:hypothetical protein